MKFPIQKFKPLYHSMRYSIMKSDARPQSYSKKKKSWSENSKNTTFDNNSMANNQIIMFISSNEICWCVESNNMWIIGIWSVLSLSHSPLSASLVATQVFNFIFVEDYQTGKRTAKGGWRPARARTNHYGVHLHSTCGTSICWWIANLS